MKIIGYAAFSDENTACQTQENTSHLTYPLTNMGWGGMVSIIFIHLGFWMGQQPFIPEGSLQVLVPSGHRCVSSGKKTLPDRRCR